MVEQLRFLFFQIENLVSSNNQISTKLLFSYFDLHGVSDKTKCQKISKIRPKVQCHGTVALARWAPLDMNKYYL